MRRNGKQLFWAGALNGWVIAKSHPAQKIHASRHWCNMHVHQFWWVWPLRFQRYRYPQKRPNSPFEQWTIVHGRQKIKSVQKIYASRAWCEMHANQFWWAWPFRFRSYVSFLFSFKTAKIFLQTLDYIVHGGQKIELAQKFMICTCSPSLVVNSPFVFLVMRIYSTHWQMHVMLIMNGYMVMSSSQLIIFVYRPALPFIPWFVFFPFCFCYSFRLFSWWQMILWIDQLQDVDSCVGIRRCS